MPGRLSESLLPGELNLEVTAKAGGFDERLRAELLCPERFVVACSAGHRFARRHAVSMREMGREVYLQRISFEYRDMLREHCEACGTNILHCCRSEREDWIQIMVAAGMGMCFLPEFPATQPGLVLRPIPGSGGAAGGLPGRSRRPALVPAARRLRPGHQPPSLARDGWHRAGSGSRGVVVARPCRRGRRTPPVVSGAPCPCGSRAQWLSARRFRCDG